MEKNNHGSEMLTCNLCKQLENSQHAPGLLAAALYGMITSLGFYRKSDNAIDDNKEVLPEEWTKSSVTVFRQEFFVTGYDNCRCFCVIIVSGDDMMVNFISGTDNLIFCDSVSLQNYVPNPCSPSIMSKYFAYGKFKYRMESMVIIPALHHELTAAGYLNASLAGLPEEVLKYLLTHYLNGVHAARLSGVCRRFWNIINDETLWKRYLQREYYCHYVYIHKRSNLKWRYEYGRCKDLMF